MTIIKAARPIAARYTKSREDAEDVIQKSCLKALSSGGPDDASKTVAWFKQIVRHTAINLVTRKRTTEPLEDYIEKRYNIDAGLEAEWLRRQIRSLPARQEMAVTLYGLEELTMPEAAEKMGCSVPTVKTHYRLGMLKLKKIAEEL